MLQPRTTTAFDDMPNDLPFDVFTPDAAQYTGNPMHDAQADAAPVEFYKEKCQRCRGSGSYGRLTRLGHSRCNACEGRGFKLFKQSPEKRAQQAKARDNAAARKVQEKAEATMRWRAANPEAAAWIDRNEGRFDFATSMSQALVDWGRLTDGQLAAVVRCIEKDKARTAEAASRHVNAPVLDAAPMEAAFDRARANGLKRLSIRIGGFKIKPAKETSQNAGALYVTGEPEGSYLGKIMGGKFLRVRDCSPEREAQVVEACRDPLAAMVAHGRLTGQCSICSRELTDPESIERGIGPECAAKLAA